MHSIGQNVDLIEITSQNFASEVEQSLLPCLVLFDAGWCAMCSEMAPVGLSVAESLGGAVKACRVDIDQERALRIRFAVAAIPYLVLVHDGLLTPLFDQAVSTEALKERLDLVLSGGDAPTTRPLPKPAPDRSPRASAASL